MGPHGVNGKMSRAAFRVTRVSLETLTLDMAKCACVCQEFTPAQQSGTPRWQIAQNVQCKISAPAWAVFAWGMETTGLHGPLQSAQPLAG